MKRFSCLSLVAVLFAASFLSMASLATAGEKSTEDSARKYTDDFLAGNMQTLLDHASPDLKKLMKDAATLRTMRAATVGDKAVTTGDQVEYTRLMKSSAGKTWVIVATVAKDGQLIGFAIQPAGDNLTPKK